MLVDDIRAMGQIESVRYDSMLANAPLPLRALYYPLGFPLEVFTNSGAVLTAAEESWNLFAPRFSTPPLTLHIEVTNKSIDSAAIPPASICKMHANLMAVVADSDNCVISDLNSGVSFGWVTQQSAESTLYLRYHILEAAALSMVAALRAVPLHAACVAPLGYGLLLCGDSGAGKSSLAFAGARAGWTFVSDDASYLLFDREDRMVVGNCHKIRLRESGVQLFPEIEGRPVTPRATGKPSIEIPTADMPELVKSDSAIVKSIIFLNRCGVESPVLVPFSREIAGTWFDQFLYPGTVFYETQKRVLHHLLDIDMFELRYTDLDWAIERLETLAATGR